MKTQISTLQRGNQKLGIVGTSHEVRNAIAEAVVRENPEGMNVRVNGHEYKMNICRSISGKTVSFISDPLTTEQVREILPGDFKAINHPELVHVKFSINSDMTCEYKTNRRVNVNRQFKIGTTYLVNEKDVTIL